VPTVHSADEIARALAESAERDLWHDHALAMWVDGYLACLAELADLIGGRIFPPSPSPLDVLRWGPGGRAHAGDPRPGDYPGKGEAA
jgi:hypothetical protein